MPSESSITGEIPPLGRSNLRCRAVLASGPHKGHECGELLTYYESVTALIEGGATVISTGLSNSGRQPGGYYVHLDPALDRDHSPTRPRPLRGVEQPRWLDSRSHRTLLVYVGLLGGLLVFTLVREGWRETLILAGLVTLFASFISLGYWWSSRATRP